MPNRRRIRSKKHARRRKKNQRRRWGIYAVVPAILLALLVGLTHWSSVQVKSVSATTEDFIDSELVVEVAENAINQPWLWGVVSRDNILLLPWKEIRHQVQGISPRIKTVDVGLDSLREVDITVKNRKPVAQVCQPVSGKSDDCRVVDKTGFMFADTDNTKEEAQVDFRYIMDSRPVSGRQFLPTDKFRKLEKLTVQLKEIGMQSDRLIIGDYGDFIIPVTSTETEQSVDIKMNINEDLLQAVSNLRVAIENESFKSEGESTESVSPFALEYIDLRFDNKIFYK